MAIRNFPVLECASLVLDDHDARDVIGSLAVDKCADTCTDTLHPL